MVDFSNPLDAYLKSKGLENTPEERKKVEEDLSDLVTLFRRDEDGGYRDNRTDSLFDLEAGTVMSEADFETLISDATEGQYDPNDLALLYEILNSDGEDGLSYDELSILAKNGEISRSSMYFALHGECSYDAAPKEDSNGSTDGTGGTDSTGGTGSIGGTDDDGAVNPEVPAEEDVAEPSETQTEESLATVEVSDSVINELKDLVRKIVTNDDDDNYNNPASVIDFWKNNPNAIADMLPEGADLNQVLDDLSVSYITYSEDGETKISTYMMMANCSRTEAINALKSELGTPETTDETELQPVYSETVPDETSTSIDEMRASIAETMAENPSITNPEMIISQLDPNKYGQDFIDDLRASYNVYENEAEIDANWEIAKYNNPDITRLEVIETMRKNGTLGKLVSSSSDTVKYENTSPVDPNTNTGLTKNSLAINNMIQEIKDATVGVFWGTNVDALEKLIINNDEFKAGDWVQIMKEYPEVLNVLEDELAHSDEERDLRDKIMEKMTNALLTEVANGNPVALDVLCEQMNISTKAEYIFGTGMDGTPAYYTYENEHFVNSFFEKVDNETLYKLIEAYDEKYAKNGSDLTLKNHIESYNMLSSNSDFLRQIDEAINEYGVLD